VSPETAGNMGDGSRNMNETMARLLTYGDGSADTIKAAAQEIDKSQQQNG
jgi:hypothetical protein